MSEGLFWSQKTDAFLSTHPYEDGWKVYTYPEEAAERLFLRLLPDYLRDSCPEVVTRREISRVVEIDELIETPGKSHVAETGGEWDLKNEMNAISWKGHIHVEWEHQPIHVFAFTVSAGYGWNDIFMVATRSNRALRKFHAAIEHYARTVRMKSTCREIVVVNGENIQVRPVSWGDVMLPTGFLEDIRSNVQGFFQSGELYHQLGLPYRRGFLFAGPPGCGKTATLRALATNIPAKFITVLGRFDVRDDDIEQALYVANKHAPAVVLLEDLDKLIASEKISLAHLLNMLDGLKDTNGVLVIATSNEPQKLDPALLHRPSRFDRVWKFLLPRYEQRLALLAKLAGDRFSDQALREAARKSEGFSMAYVQEIVVNAVLRCVDDGAIPDDSTLLSSLETLRSQRKSASKDDEVLVERESLGFCQPA